MARAIAASGTGERRLARQPAASPTKPVPLPGWGDPLTGDDTSFALFTPWAAHRPGNHAGPMSMGTFDQDGGLTGTISVKAANGNSGEVWLVVDDSFSLDGEGIVVHRFRGDWRYAIKNSWGDLEITGGNGRLVSTQGYATDDDDVKLTAIASEVEGNIVQLKATFTGTSSSSSPVSVGFQGKTGQSVGGSLGSSKASAAGGMTAVFRLRIVVEDAVQGPRDLPYRSHKHSIHYDEGKHLLDGPQTVGLADFLKSHQKVVAMLTSTDVASEDAKVRISAFASPKGRPQDNLDLAEARANEVRRRLTQLGVRPQNIVHTRSPESSAVQRRASRPATKRPGPTSAWTSRSARPSPRTRTSAWPGLPRTPEAHAIRLLGHPRAAGGARRAESTCDASRTGWPGPARRATARSVGPAAARTAPARAAAINPDCVVPLCWRQRRAYDTGRLELLPVSSRAGGPRSRRRLPRGTDQRAAAVVARQR